MRKSEIITIVLQEEEIKRLRIRNKTLERGFADLWKQVAQLRARIEKAEGSENKLKGVNV